MSAQNAPNAPNYANVSSTTIEMMIHADDPPWLTLALREQGNCEVKGNGHNARILEYHACTTLGATTDEVPWCSSFLCWVMESSGITSTSSAASLSWLRWGREISKPVRGCVVVFDRVDANGVVIPNRGHVGLWMGAGTGGSGNPVTYVLGGNQRDSVMISAMKSSRVKSYRMPATMKRSTTVMASTTVGTGTVLAAAPTVVSLIGNISEKQEQVAAATEVFGRTRSIAGSLFTDPTMIALTIGVLVVAGGLAYIINERRKKIQDFGI